MKKTLAGFCLGLAVAVCVAAATSKTSVPNTGNSFFCPRGITAIVLTLNDRINVLEKKADVSLVPVSTNDVIQAVIDRMNTLQQFGSETNDISSKSVISIE